MSSMYFVFIVIAFIFVLWLCFDSKKLQVASAALALPVATYASIFIEEWMTPTPIFYQLIFVVMFVVYIFPSLVVISLLIPKKIFKLKYKTICFLVLVFLGFLTVVLCEPNKYYLEQRLPEKYQNRYFNPITERKLGVYSQLIDYIEKYKTEHGQYPINVFGYIPENKEFKHCLYKTYNNNKDFVLFVGDEIKSVYPKNKQADDIDSSIGFRYCSSQTLPFCNTDGKQFKNVYTIKIGNWSQLYQF